jgi:hypothetical protein
MIKQGGVGNFGDGWPREKLLCYDVQCHVVGALGYIELLQESKLNPGDAKLLDHMFKSMRLGAEQVQELYKIICEKEKAGTL